MPKRVLRSTSIPMAEPFFLLTDDQVVQPVVGNGPVSGLGRGPLLIMTMGCEKRFWRWSR
ncbi:hypothetical protein SGFS_082370 [Streptomyces graminofaciens]|uniref:Uncharacterized protein n=1 Tax=Streptomyces graminofaciens TaxID=68212 RepID=A0ABM8HM00_9ACTN|nr:hypothetical protein SGFS_082370 [Streptomyces graminofaciens]